MSRKQLQLKPTRNDVVILAVLFLRNEGVVGYQDSPQTAIFGR